MNKELLHELDKTNSDLISLLSSFNQEQFNNIPFEGSWTAAQVAAHLSKSDAGVVQLLWGEAKPAERAPDQYVERIKKDFLNFSIKMKSPQIIIPENTQYDKDALIHSLSQTRAHIREAATTLDLSQICLAFPFPGYGELTRWEVLSFNLYHTQRHLHQLQKISQKVRNNSPEKEAIQDETLQ